MLRYQFKGGVNAATSPITAHVQGAHVEAVAACAVTAAAPMQGTKHSVLSPNPASLGTQLYVLSLFGLKISPARFHFKCILPFK